MNTSAESAGLLKTPTLFRSFRDSIHIRRANLGRCPRLLHFPPLAQANRLAIQSFITQHE
jgi:hypothetical protein